MVDLQESEDVLILIRGDKSKLFYDLFGLVSFLFLGVLLINPYKGLNLRDEDLIWGWFTAALGIILCLTLVLTKEHTSKWTFDKRTSCLMIEYQGLGGSRCFEFPLEQIQSVKVIYSRTGNAQILLPELKPVPISMGKIPLERVNSYAKTITNFLELDSSNL
jgi:hypothetical protein